MSLFSALLCLVAVSPGYAPAPEVELLHFESPGCAACRTMAPTVERLSKTGLAIRHIDISDDPDTKDKYRVRVVPSFVVLVRGEECVRHEGTATFDRLNSIVVQARRASTSGGAAEAEQFVSTEADAPAMAATRDPLQVRQAALNSAVRIRIEDRPGMIAYGTGTIIDARDGKALVITCGHLFRDSGGKGKITVDAFVDGAKRTVDARLLDYDLEYEIGLLIITPGGQVATSRVADQSGQPEPGQALFSVGCSSGDDPTIMEVQVTAIDRFTGAPNIECTGSPIEGRSGGGLFDEQGRLVAICFGRLDREPRGAYSGLPTVHWILTKHNFTDMFEASPQPSAAPRNQVAIDDRSAPLAQDREPVSDSKPMSSKPRRAKPQPAGELVAASENAAEPEEKDELPLPPKRSPRKTPSTKESTDNKKLAATPPPSSGERKHPDAPTANRSRLAKVLDEQLAKLDPSAEDADLILIMKSKGGPTAKHKVLVLDDPSPELMTRLAQERQAQELISSLPTRKPAPAQLAKTGRASGAKIAMRQDDEETGAQ